MYRKEYYEKNRDKFKEYHSRYYGKHKEQVKEYQKKYFQENKEDVYEKQKEWRNNNKDKWIKAIGDSRKRRIERMREEGITNPWGVLMRGSKPKYRKED